MAAVFPEPVFNVLCRVVSVLLRHLTVIDWRTLLTRMGGWVSNIPDKVNILNLRQYELRKRNSLHFSFCQGEL